jgi:hypothetical protein
LSDTTGGTDYGNHNWNVELDNTNLSDNNKYLELQIPKTHINLNTNYRIAFYSIKDIDEDNIHGDTAETNMNVSFH